MGRGDIDDDERGLEKLLGRDVGAEEVVGEVGRAQGPGGERGEQELPEEEEAVVPGRAGDERRRDGHRLGRPGEDAARAAVAVDEHLAEHEDGVDPVGVRGLVLRLAEQVGEEAAIDGLDADDGGEDGGGGRRAVGEAPDGVAGQASRTPAPWSLGLISMAA